MAATVPEIPDPTTEARAAAAAANSVPQLAAALDTALDAIARLEAKVERLEGRRR